MDPLNPFSDLPIGQLFETLLPDFILAFAFFTALVYGVLAKRFQHQRSAVTVSATAAFALSVGLVWWEQRTGFSIRDLGPFAVGLAIIVLAAVMYQAIRQVGGSWAGIGIALGASLLVSRLVGVNWPIDAQVIQTVITVALILGILAFVGHRSWHAMGAPFRHAVLPPVRHDMRDRQEGRALSDLLRRRFRDIERRTDRLREHPADGQDILLQLRRMLPAEGWLTERLAGLREKVVRMRKGHVARIEEIRELARQLPVGAKRALSQQMQEQYRELGLELRLERLDQAVAANEKRIRELTSEAEQATVRYDYQRLHDLLKAAEKLQKHNTSLFGIIDRTEKRLIAAAREAAQKAGGAAAA